MYGIHQPGMQVNVEALLASEHIPAGLAEAMQYGYSYQWTGRPPKLRQKNSDHATKAAPRRGPRQAGSTSMGMSEAHCSTRHGRLARLRAVSPRCKTLSIPWVCPRKTETPSRHSHSDTSHMVHVNDRIFNDPRYCICSRKLTGLGWAPVVERGEGLRETVARYMDPENMSGRLSAEEVAHAMKPHSDRVNGSRDNGGVLRLYSAYFRPNAAYLRVSASGIPETKTTRINVKMIMKSMTRTRFGMYLIFFGLK